MTPPELTAPDPGAPATPTVGVPPSGGPTAPVQLLPLKHLATLLATPSRWLILQELAKGEPLPVTVIAQRIGQSPDSTSKQLAILRRIGVVITGYGRLYTFSPPFRPAPGTRTISLGPCTLHFEAPLH